MCLLAPLVPRARVATLPLITGMLQIVLVLDRYRYNLFCSKRMKDRTPADSEERNFRPTPRGARLYDPHWTEDELAKSLKKEAIYEGVIRFNASNRKEAFVKLPGFKCLFWICDVFPCHISCWYC